MRNYNRNNNRVNRAKRDLKRESKATLHAGLGLVPRLGTAIGIYDTANGAARTARAAVRYGAAVKRQTVTRVQNKINSTTRPIRNGINAINRLVR